MRMSFSLRVVVVRASVPEYPEADGKSKYAVFLTWLQLLLANNKTAAEAEGLYGGTRKRRLRHNVARSQYL